MSSRTRRPDSLIFPWLRAAVTGSAIYLGMTALGVSPAIAPLVLAVVGGALSLLVGELGVLTAVTALSLPLIATAPVLGVGFFVIGLASARYFGTIDGRGFMVIAVAVAAAFFGPVWASVALAGLVLGASRGAVVAAAACVLVQALGIALGVDAVGVIHAGGGSPLIDSELMPASLLAVSWFSDSLRTIDAAMVNRTVSAFTSASQPWILLTQPLLWAAGAVIAGSAAKQARRRGRLLESLLGVTASVGLLYAGSYLLSLSAGTELSPADLAQTGLLSAALAAIAVVLQDRLFLVEARTSQTPVSICSDDADVDELLRLISTTEEKLASQHTATRTVMITDMKAFSTMTEEEGSLLSAKAIQRQRDLLLPIIQRHGGAGKSTGGDGLIAAFEDPGSALLAASEIQRALTIQNDLRPSERALCVRIGVASGEVILDRNGRPFIGAAINLAARVMGLADGGQCYTTAEVARAAKGQVATRSLGHFDLKNIAEQTEVAELLWNVDGGIRGDHEQETGA